MKYKIPYLILFLLISLLFWGCNTKVIQLKKKEPATLNIVQNKTFQIPKLGFIYISDDVSIYDIANKYRLLPQEIIKANNLKAPYKLSKGQKLFLPFPLIHVVRSGDTISTITIQYAVKLNELLELNDLNKSDTLSVDQNIKIPLKKNYDVVGLVIREKNLTLLKPRDLSLDLKKMPKFIWPVKGKITKKFGSYANGKQHNDGIDILVDNDSKVIASFDAKVAFVGSRIKSFGNMILLKHDKEWISAYSKIDFSMVKEGDIVKKGQVIAQLKKNSSLHFQIRKSRNPINPESILINQ